MTGSANTKKAACRQPTGDPDFDPPASVETLLVSGNLMPDLDGRVLGALVPWVSELTHEELGWVRAVLLAQLTMDPELRGLVARVARAREAAPSDAPGGPLAPSGRRE